MNELEKTVLNELVRTVGIILEKVENIENRLSPHLSDTDKREVLTLINDALLRGKGVADNNLKGVSTQSTSLNGIEGTK